ncbi:MAG: hypothetical protein K2X99_13265 [Gemmatimonadaceae bacterium]|nr:hypothetical protein [Gemmatimonadaceae bacterium]
MSALAAGAASAAVLGSAAIEGGGSQVEVIPEVGARVRSLRLAGRQWLWHDPDRPVIAGEVGASFRDIGERGGWDECFPSIAPGRVPEWVKGSGGRALGDHGDCWTQAPSLTLATDVAGHRASCTWRAREMGWRLTRTITARPDGVVRCDYEAETRGPAKLPFVWGVHAPLELSARTVVELPEGARVRVIAQSGIDLGPPSTEHRWPLLRVGDKLRDLSRPWSVAKRYAVTLIVDLSATRVAVREGRHRLTVRGELGGTSVARVVVNRGALAPPSAARGWWPWAAVRAPQFVSVTPMLGAPESLADALGDWKGAQWLEPGVPRRWWTEWSGEERDDMAE